MADKYDKHAARSYDYPDAVTGAFTYYERAESMDLINDPRFFNGNVIEKRLTAFMGLNVLGMFALSHCLSMAFSLKKDFVLSTFEGCFQMFSFCIMAVTSFMLIVAIFVQTNQVYYVHRLLTAGPTGFEQASLFYLNSTMTKWRHFSMKSLMLGLMGYMLTAGAILSVKFVKDAEGKVEKKELNLTNHIIIAILVFAAFLLCALLLLHIWHVHRECYRDHHDFACDLQMQLTGPMRAMQSRAGGLAQSYRDTGRHSLDI